MRTPTNAHTHTYIVYNKLLPCNPFTFTHLLFVDAGGLSSNNLLGNNLLGYNLLGNNLLGSNLRDRLLGNNLLRDDLLRGSLLGGGGGSGFAERGELETGVEAENPSNERNTNTQQRERVRGDTTRISPVLRRISFQRPSGGARGEIPPLISSLWRNTVSLTWPKSFSLSHLVDGLGAAKKGPVKALADAMIRKAEKYFIFSLN